MQNFVNEFNASYANKHERFETQFWGTKMALESTDSQTYSTALLAQTKKEMEDLLSDPKVLSDAKAHKAAVTSVVTNDAGEEKLSEDDSIVNLIKTLEIIIRTCQCNEFPTKEAKSIREETNKIEGALEMSRNSMELGYTKPNGDFQAASSVALRNLMRTSDDEATRKAAYQGLRTIGPFVCENGFLEIVKLRNKLAKLLGFEDYYDYTVTNAEGFSKKKLFEILDGLEEGTRTLNEKARDELKKRHGDTALEPWNMGFVMAGSVIKKMVCSITTFIIVKSFSN